jgi:hypothetical protein
VGSSTSATPDPSTLGVGRGFSPNVNSPDPNQAKNLQTPGPLAVPKGSDGQVATARSTAAFGNDFEALPVSGPLATAYETLLADTTLDQILTYTPAAAGLFRIQLYFRVVTATTTVTLQVTWTDATGVQTLNVVNAVSETVGSYTVLPVMVASAAGQAVTVSAQAGTANQVYVSATLAQ